MATPCPRLRRRKGRAPARGCSRRSGPRHTSDVTARSRAAPCRPARAGVSRRNRRRPCAARPRHRANLSASRRPRRRGNRAPSAARFVNRALIVVDCPSPDLVRCEHPAAAVTGHLQAVVLDHFYGSGEPDLGDLVAPRIDRLDVRRTHASTASGSSTARARSPD